MPHFSSKKKPKVLIVGQFSFPTGSAAAARIRNLSLGLEESGAEVHLLPIQLSVEASDSKVSWFSENISYELLVRSSRKLGLKSRNPWYSKPVWFVSSYYVGWKIANRVAEIARKRECDLVICYGRSGWQLMPIAKRCRQLGIVTVLDVVELRSQFVGIGGVLNPVFWDWLYGEIAMPKGFWGITAITDLLAGYYLKKGCARSLVIPAIEDWSIECPVSKRRVSPKFRILTTSALIPRDAPDQIIDLVRLLARQKCNFELSIVGRYEETPVAQASLSVLMKDPILRRHVKLCGRVTDEKLAQLRSETDCLLLTRRDSEAERYSFPTRLVEYLRSGKPVVVAAVGEIPKYLHDETDAMLFDPANVGEAARKILQLSMNDDLVFKIAESGFRRGAECFNRTVHARRLLGFALGSSSGFGHR